MQDPNAYQQLIAQCWADEAFKNRLLENPAQVLAEQGMTLPPGTRIAVVADTEETYHLVIPQKPDDLSDEQLTASAGAPCDISCFATRICW